MLFWHLHPSIQKQLLKDPVADIDPSVSQPDVVFLIFDEAQLCKLSDLFTIDLLQSATEFFFKLCL